MNDRNDKRGEIPDRLIRLAEEANANGARASIRWTSEPDEAVSATLKGADQDIRGTDTEATIDATLPAVDLGEGATLTETRTTANSRADGFDPTGSTAVYAYLGGGLLCAAAAVVLIRLRMTTEAVLAGAVSLLCFASMAFPALWLWLLGGVAAAAVVYLIVTTRGKAKNAAIAEAASAARARSERALATVVQTIEDLGKDDPNAKTATVRHIDIATKSDRATRDAIKDAKAPTATPSA